MAPPTPLTLSCKGNIILLHLTAALGLYLISLPISKASTEPRQESLLAADELLYVQLEDGEMQKLVFVCNLEQCGRNGGGDEQKLLCHYYSE